MNDEKNKDKGISRISFNDTNSPISKEHTAPLPEEKASSSSSVKLRKSSNIFSTLVRKARRKKRGNKSSNDAVKTLNISSQNLTCSSTLSLATRIEEEVELRCQNYDRKCSQTQEVLWERQDVGSETNTSNQSEAPSIKMTGDVFGFRNGFFCHQECKDDNSQSTSKDHHKQYEIRERKESKVPKLHDNNSKGAIILTSFIKFSKPTLNVAIADALQYLREVINGFHESEIHIVNLLAKYITDPDVQKEMTIAISNHVKLQWEVERKSCSLVNDIWMQQLEIERAQKKILQDTVHSLVKQNRQLQIENESLYRKYEKSNKLLKGYSDHKSRYQEGDSQIEPILCHNEKLQTKLESLFKKIESLEEELHIFQTQNDNIEEQLRMSTMKIQNMNSTFHRLQIDYEIEQVSLNFKLESKERVVKEVCEIAEIVMEDLDSWKRQMKNLPLELSWPKFKARDNCLTDFIHICRSCINEMSKELIGMHTKNSLKDKDIISLQETNKNLEQNLKKSLNETEILLKKIEESSTALDEKRLLEQKCQMLEDELKTSEDKIRELKSNYDIEKSNILQRFVDQTQYIKELEDKDKMIEQTKVFVEKTRSENYSLQNEIVMLNKIIKKTGAGDMVKEIEHKYEELDLFKREMEKLKTENTHIKIQAEASKNQNTVLVTNQELAYRTLQRQVQEIERLNEDNQTLKHKLDTEHQTVLSLQNERMKYLEEKNLLKSIIQHLKAELSKIRLLENNVSAVSKEASKLGHLAEYNKQQSEKLKQEVLERNNTIAQLKITMEKLNEVQMQSAKEKLSLCHELNEVSQLKEKLSEVLNSELKKNAELGQSKEAIVKSVHSQIQKIEDRERNERTAIRILLRDLKNVTEEKENITKERYKLQAEIEELTVKHNVQEEKHQNTTNELTMKIEEIKVLRKEIEHYKKGHKELERKLENEMFKYDLNIKQLTKLIEQLREDKQHLENSTEYLKNDVEKLYKDLNQIKETEKSTIDILNQVKQEKEATQQSLNEQKQVANSLLKEKEQCMAEKHQLIVEKNSLIKKNEYLNTLMDKVVNDFEKSVNTAEQKEKMFKDELDEVKHILYKYGKENQGLKKAIQIKEARLKELQDIGDTNQFQKKQYNRLKEEMNQLEKAYEDLKEHKEDLTNQITELQDKYNNLISHIKDLEEESVVLESQLEIVLNQKEEDYRFYKKHIAETLKAREELNEQNHKEIDKLNLRLEDITVKLQSERIAYERLSQIHKDTNGKFMQSLQDMADVNDSKQDIMEKIKEDKINADELENDKRALQKEISILSGNLETINNELKQKIEENSILQQKYAKILEKCVLAEEQVQQMEIEQKQKYQEDMSMVKQSDTSEIEIKRLKNEAEENLSTIHRLKIEILDLQKEIVLSRLERSEISLRLEETQKKMETERNLGEQLKNTQKLLLAAVIQLRDDGKVDSSDCIHLLHLARSSSHLSTDGTKRN